MQFIKMKCYKLNNKSYSCRRGTYNALWLDEQGQPAFWGSYNPEEGSFYLSTPAGVVASGMWMEEDGDLKFQLEGTYNYEDVRKSLQLGIL